MKNKEKAKQIEVMAGYTIGMPGYKEPEEKVKEPQEEVPLENREKLGKNEFKTSDKAH